ncbi:lipase secretion chaperone [Acinetobacter gerneri]|jgi:lipase chaperone LimK|uniref:lipase secretion chaperone n=1 Tax=Acinetobacter gerneri TaxID=202952 RepID=UPI0023F38063|nr:lipase secretion chaperone [Acinetobacter gerneri]MCH4243246.1 lipase secretion chaperone [Acinetobacter gerneri]
MQWMQKKYIWLICSLVVASILALVYWLKPNSSTPPTQSNIQNSQTANIEPFSTQKISAQAQSFASKSQQDTQVNCQIRSDASNHLIVNEQTKDCFEYFLTQYGEKNLEQIKADFLKFVQSSYENPLNAELDDLWQRYLKYRNDLGHLQASQTEHNDAQYYRKIFSKINDLKKKYFSSVEIAGLFGNEDLYNNYTLNRMDILADKNLNTTEKASKLKQLSDGLPQDWQDNLKQINQLDDLRKLTAELKAKGGSAQDIHDMRTQLVGAEATQRFENLDAQRSDWSNRVNQFLSARDNIKQSGMSDSAKQSAISQLRNQQFNQQESLRIQTFENVHDQGGKLPFAQ